MPLARKAAWPARAIQRAALVWDVPKPWAPGAFDRPLSMSRDKDLGEEIRIAHKIQMSTLPSFFPNVRDYDFFGKFWPADETGGDSFDLVSVAEDTVFVLLADATGHGIGPALSALQVQSMLRVALRLGATLDEAFEHINAQMVEDLPEGRFVTAFFGLLNTATHELEYQSAGQGPILHFHEQDGALEWQDPACAPMGFMEHLERHRSKRLTMGAGDILALISDGIFEYENEQKAMFGMERVAQLIQSHRDLPMQALAETINAAAVEFGGSAPQRDDITIVLIRRKLT
jgi:sigma-B regulation protein RsbU (phosphoserine phosphatase)